MKATFKGYGVCTIIKLYKYSAIIKTKWGIRYVSLQYREA